MQLFTNWSKWRLGFMIAWHWVCLLLCKEERKLFILNGAYSFRTYKLSACLLRTIIYSSISQQPLSHLITTLFLSDFAVVCCMLFRGALPYWMLIAENSPALHMQKDLSFPEYSVELTIFQVTLIYPFLFLTLYSSLKASLSSCK